MDITKGFVDKLYAANKSLSKDNSEKYFNNHQLFLRRRTSDIGVQITDEYFTSRMHICEQAVR